MDETKIEKAIFEKSAKHALPYILIYPKMYKDKTGDERVPILLFLHGAGERGRDNESQLKHGRDMLMAAADQYGCFVLVPQCPATQAWVQAVTTRSSKEYRFAASEALDMVWELLVSLIHKFPIDTHRVYIMGISMGGFATWQLLQKHPGFFAAAVPICGGGDPSGIEVMLKTPIWAIHGAQDDIVPADYSRIMVERLEAAGGSIRYTEYADAGHDSWTRSFENPDLLKCLFQQANPNPKQPS